jgi:hypothetical protein
LNAQGIASLTTSLPVGNYSIVAKYLGDVVTTPSTSAASAIVVKTISTTTLQLSVPSIIQGQSATLTATVMPNSATSTVNFIISNSNETISAYGTITQGVASYNTPVSLVAGTYSIVANYTGDSATTASSSAASTFTVQSISTTTLQISAPRIPQGQSATLNATIQPLSATGTVNFVDSTIGLLGTGTLNAGVASFTTPISLGAGNYSIIAQYQGDVATAASSSAASTFVVAIVSTTVLQISPASIQAGQSATLNATVQPSSATGSVNFNSDPQTTIGASTLNSQGVALFQTPTTLPVGNYAITANYQGDSATMSSSSAPSNLLVSATAIQYAASTTALQISAAIIRQGQSTILSATVLPSSATGVVTFIDSNTGRTIGVSSALNAGVASFDTPTTLAAQSYSIVAQYAGDNNTSNSSSIASVLVVNPAVTPLMTLTSSASIITAGQSVTFTLTMRNSDATGIVGFQQGSTVLGTKTLTNQTASVTVTSLSVGTWPITAYYLGDSNYAPATQTISESVIAVAPTTAVAQTTVIAIAAASVLLVSAISIVVYTKRKPTQ